MPVEPGASVERPQVAPRRWSTTNSRQIMKSYDHSPVHSPSTTPPTLSRHSSTTSIDSTRSEPAWHSDRHQFAPTQPSSGSLKKENNASQAPVQTTASHKEKKTGLKGLFSRHKDPAAKEKERQENDRQRIILLNRHAAGVKYKITLDPAYCDFEKKHKRPKVKTAGITEYTASAKTPVAILEARYPHSGPPALHGSSENAALTRIESRDDPDDELDPWEAQRREWNEEHNMPNIPEIRSRAASRHVSPWASPIASREPSPNRLGARPGMGSKRNSYGGGYHKDPVTGRWTKKTTPPTMTPVYPNHGGVNPDLLAASLAERLSMQV